MKYKGLSLLRHYPFTMALTLFIWIVCLIPIPETPLSGVSFIDKWTHFALFGLLTLLVWLETLGHRLKATRKQMALWGVLMPWLMGGLVEIVQATCTHGVRNGDVFDFLADGVGVAIGAAIGILLARYLSTRNRD